METKRWILSWRIFLLSSIVSKLFDRPLSLAFLRFTHRYALAQTETGFFLLLNVLKPVKKNRYVPLQLKLLRANPPSPFFLDNTKLLMQFSSLKCVNDFSTCFSCFFMMRRMLNYNSRVNVTYSSSFFNIFSVSSLCQWLMIVWSRPVAKPLVSVSPTLFILVILAPMIRGWTSLQCKRFLCARRVSVLERKACALPFTASTREKFATVKQSTWNLRLLLSLHTLLIY